MSACPNCGNTISEEEVHCGNCGTTINALTMAASASQPTSTSLNNPDSKSTMRLKKALRRTELLSYAAVGLGLAILGVLIVIALLNT